MGRLEVWDLVLALLAIAALVAVASRLGFGPPRPASWLIGPAIAALVIVLYLLIDPPPAVADGDVSTGLWLALAAAVLMTAGALLSVARISVAINPADAFGRDHDGPGDRGGRFGRRGAGPVAGDPVDRGPVGPAARRSRPRGTRSPGPGRRAPADTADRAHAPHLTAAPTPRVVTIGVYEFDLPSFLAALRAHDVGLLVDVRQRRGVRGARYAWANARRLQAALADAGDRLPPPPRARADDRAAPPAVRRRRPQPGRQALARDARSGYVEGYVREILDPADLDALVAELPADARRRCCAWRPIPRPATAR